MSSYSQWTEAQVPDQTGKRVLVTGANSGIGLETAKVLAARGAEVIMACRSAEVLAALNERSVRDAMAEIRDRHPTAKLELLQLDLARQASIEAAARTFYERFDRLDLLINNAGVMWLPRSKTEDGFETQMAINHLGHFALTGRLLPALTRAPSSRVVTVSSLTHMTAQLDLEDLFYTRRTYRPSKVYAQTKLANLLFARELGRRFAAFGARALSVAAHPGLAATNLFVSAFPRSKLLRSVFTAGTALIGQSGLQGARPTLYAATMEGLSHGDYIGPSGFLQLWGPPASVASTKVSRDPDLARRLWAISERLTGVRYGFESVST